MKLTITNKRPAAMGNGTFYTGTIDGCEFQAKVYDLPSNFGINEGRVSKLLLRSTDGSPFAAYDRGWDILPRTQEQLDMLQAVLDHFA